MKHLSTISALFLLTLGLASCGGSSSDPTPTTTITTPPPTPTAPASKEHAVVVRYSLRSNGDASQLPAKAPTVTVYYQSLTPQTAGGYSVSARLQKGIYRDMSTTVKEVALPAVTTYANSGAVKPVIEVYIAVDQLPPVGPNKGFTANAEIIIDGVAYPVTTYSGNLAVASLNSALFNVGRMEVAH